MSIFIKGNVHGDVIEAGGVKNVTNNYHGEKLAENAEQTGVNEDGAEADEQLTFLVHPSISEAEGRKVHREIKRLVSSQGIQEICKYLAQLSADKKVLLPQNAEKAYNELVRLGMPDGEGYSLKTFTKYYKR
jgi:hypothetical protein